MQIKSTKRLNSLKLFPEDIIAIIFSLAIILTIVYFLFTGDISDTNVIITPVVSLMILIFFMVYQSSTSSNAVKFLRSYLHIPYYGIIFSAFQAFIHKLNPNDFDYLLLKLDYTFFGFDITVWLEHFISKQLTEILTLSYFSYYILPTLTFILLFIKKDPLSFQKVRSYLLAIVIGWYGAFILYLLLPAAGPDIAFPEHYTVPLQGLSPLTNAYLENLGKYLKESFVRNTFPSMHFGIILITNYFAFKHLRKYFWFCTLLLGTLLAVATLYLRQHYLIDLVGSIPVAALSIWFSSKLCNNKRGI
ncbi:MAG: phosphatase PAP2 family protein [Ignavibacteria bacterium]|nr:phosphatase PAP2 family protein [Ignavibacteria bacterium]